MAQYMKVENGQPVPGTLIQLSTRRDRSPNIYWKKEQLEAHGWFPADTAFDPLTQKIDKTAPSFDGVKIVFPVTARPVAEIKDDVVKLWKRMLEGRVRQHLQDIYPLEDRVDAALGILPAQAVTEMKDAISGYRAWVKEVMAYVRGLGTLKAINALGIDAAQKQIYTTDAQGTRVIVNTTPA